MHIFFSFAAVGLVEIFKSSIIHQLVVVQSKSTFRLANFIFVFFIFGIEFKRLLRLFLDLF